MNRSAAITEILRRKDLGEMDIKIRLADGREYIVTTNKSPPGTTAISNLVEPDDELSVI